MLDNLSGSQAFVIVSVISSVLAFIGSMCMALINWRIEHKRIDATSEVLLAAINASSSDVDPSDILAEIASPRKMSSNLGLDRGKVKQGRELPFFRFGARRASSVISLNQQHGGGVERGE